MTHKPSEDATRTGEKPYSRYKNIDMSAWYKLVEDTPELVKRICKPSHFKEESKKNEQST